MAQYQTGTVSTVSGSVTVNGLGTAWLTEVQSNDEFILEDSLGGGAFVVASVIDDTTLTLTAPFPLTLNNQNYTIARDFSAKLNFGLIYKNDVEHATIDRRNWLILDNLVGSPAGTIIQIDGATVFADLNDTPSSFTGQELKLVRVADGSPSTDLEFVGVSDVLDDVTLGQIGDVQGSPNPEDGQFLQYDTATSEWIYVDIAPGAGATELDELTDVSVSGETDGDILVYSGGNFINSKTVSSVLTYGSPYTISNSGDLVHKQYVDNAVAGAGSGDSTGSPIGSLIDHQDLIGAGTNTHAQIDTHISDSSIHFTQGAISITESQISDLQSYLLNINSESIFDLSDVSGSPIPNVGQVLKWDGSKFAAESDIIGSPTGSGVTDHTLLTNIGTNTHAQLDTHVADSTIHFTEGSIDHTAITNIGTNTHAQLDSHLSDSTLHFLESSISLALSDLTDTDIPLSPTPIPDQILVYDGADWVNATPQIIDLDEISDVTITAIASGEILKWTGSQWVNNTLAEAGIQASGTYMSDLIDDVSPQLGANLDQNGFDIDDGGF